MDYVSYELQSRNITNYVSYNLGNSVECTNKGHGSLWKQGAYELKSSIHGTWIFLWNADNIHEAGIFSQDSDTRSVDLSTKFGYFHDNIHGQNEIA